MGGATALQRKIVTPARQQLRRLHELDSLSRQRALEERESRELERLLLADENRRARLGRPIPRGVR